MNFDYRQTEAEVTYRRIGLDDWAFKKIALTNSSNCHEGPENHLFDVHRTAMCGEGWALVSMEAIAEMRLPAPSSLVPTSVSTSVSTAATASKTTSFRLFWKRSKADGSVAGTSTARLAPWSTRRPRAA